MISLIVVNYRSASLSAEAVRSARAASAEPLDVIIVDNSCDPGEADALRTIDARLIVSERNAGYAAAINAGRRATKTGVMIVANPDVVFGAHAIDALVATDAAVAGPALYWDSAHQWKLPPSDLYTAPEKIDEVLASRSAFWMRARDRRRFRNRVRFWSHTKPATVRALSGAVLAIRTETFDAVGGFDERFVLYFEENDFLRRVAGRRERISYVPDARCRHIYNQSAGAEATRAAELFARSERQYLEKWNGPFLAGAIKSLERPLKAANAEPVSGPIRVPDVDAVVEASPLASFATAAGHFARGGLVDVPKDVLDSYRAGALYMRVVERATARVLATYVRHPN